MLPNLLIIGAAKAGTTSLHHYLSFHPQIDMSSKKELRFFSHEPQWNLGVAWYESQFVKPGLVHGESSTSYTQYPRFAVAPQRIRDLLPDVRLIYVVRDPIERILSHHTFSVARGRERQTLEQAVAAPDSRYVDCSRYYTQISRYLAHFDRSRILIVSSEDLQQHTQVTLQTVFRFLEVDDSFSSPEFNRRLNEVGDHRLRTPTGLRIEQVNRWPIVHWIPRRWRIVAGRYLYRPFSTPASKPPMSDDVRRALAERLRDDINRFREWTGRPFGTWSV